MFNANITSTVYLKKDIEIEKGFITQNVKVEILLLSHKIIIDKISVYKISNNNFKIYYPSEKYTINGAEKFIDYIDLDDSLKKLIKLSIVNKLQYQMAYKKADENKKKNVDHKTKVESIKKPNIDEEGRKIEYDKNGKQIIPWELDL